MVPSSMLVLVFVAVSMAQDVRLVDSNGNTDVSSGRVEVLREGVWGSVCSPTWGMAEANLVCLDLGFPGATAAAIGGDVEAPAYLPIWKDMVSCNGTDGTFAECSDAYDGDDVYQCGHEMDGYATCKSVRLASKFGGLGTTEGRVEVYMNGEWGTVCSSGFDINDAKMVCAQALSISATALRYYGSTIYGQGTGPIHMSGLECKAPRPDSVVDIFSCPRSDDTSRCGHADDVGVVCQPRGVRLVDAGGNPSTSRGRVEVGRGGTVCDRLFGQVDGDVVCRQLGYNAGALAVKPAAFYGQGSGQVTVDGSACTEADTDIALCPRFPPGVGNDCGHDRDVGVICRTNVRLVAEDGSVDGNSGRVEVYNDGRWGTVCMGGVAQTAADTVCKLLGFNLGATAFQTPYSPPDGLFTPDDISRPIAIGGLYCRGNEQNILSCAHSTGDDIHSRCSFKTNLFLTCNPNPGPAAREFEFEGDDLMAQALKELPEGKETLLSRAAELLAALEEETKV